MSFFGERQGSASCSRDRLIKRQARKLLGLAKAAMELPDFAPYIEAIAQKYVHRIIILEQFPRIRILKDELPQLDNLKGLLKYKDMSRVDIVKEVSQVSSNA